MFRNYVLFLLFSLSILIELFFNLFKVREETDTRIEVPSEGGAENTVVLAITGSKDGIEKAKEMIEALQKSLVRPVKYCPGDCTFFAGCLKWNFVRRGLCH
jgi:KH domain